MLSMLMGSTDSATAAGKFLWSDSNTLLEWFGLALGVTTAVRCFVSILFGSTKGPIADVKLSTSSSQLELVPRRSNALAEHPTFDAVHNAAVAVGSELTGVLEYSGEAVVVVDPVSTGANLADLLMRRGIAVIAVTSGQVQYDLPADSTLRLDYLASLEHDASKPEKTLSRLRALPVTLVGVVSGSELGIECTDYLSHHLGLPSNGIGGSEARRNKYLMQEAIRASGLRAVSQARVRSWEEALRFAKRTAYPLVLKPVCSAGSDHIFRVGNEREMAYAFAEIMASPNAFGLANHVVLVQEFLVGSEFIVDTVSRDGEHKVVAVWEYDKRDHAGHAFVYYGMASVDTEAEAMREMCAYTLRVLDALAIRHGAGHAEVILTKDGPCLVEIGARPQGCEGTFMPLADRVWGYNQVGVLASALLSSSSASRDGADEWALIPPLCGRPREHAFKVDLVCSTKGTLKHVAHLAAIRALASFVSLDLLPSAGAQMLVTIDCFTGCGSVSLAHHDHMQLMADVGVVRELEKTMWIVDQSE